MGSRGVRLVSRIGLDRLTDKVKTLSVMLMMRTDGALPRDDGYGIELYTGTHNRADSLDQFYRKLGESTRMKRNGRPVMT